LSVEIAIAWGGRNMESIIEPVIMNLSLDFSSALPTFLITLREGVEAALVVGIVLAYLKKADRTELNNQVYWGIAIGLVASFGLGLGFNAVLQTISMGDSPIFKQLLEGSLGLVAIAMLSWMLVWMTQNAKSLKSEIEGTVSSTLSDHAFSSLNPSSRWGIFSLIAIAVLREGIEVVLFVFAKFQAGSTPIAMAVVGGVGGLLMASAIAVALFKFGVKINIRSFFQGMGIFLLLIVAGLVISAIGHFDKAVYFWSQLPTVTQSQSFCFFSDHTDAVPSCILGATVWDASQVLPDKKFPGVLLKALLGYRDRLYLVQAIAYFSFLGIAGSLYWQSLGQKPSPSQTKKIESSPVK
jgi:high-affinity iron transporter